jgi:hypothetical protein
MFMVQRLFTAPVTIIVHGFTGRTILAR